jgi:Lon protease-like protein
VAELLPLFPLGTVLFPGLLLPLQVFEPRYRTLMADLLSDPEPWSFGVVAIREGHEVGASSVKSLYDVGCVAVIQQVEQLPDGRFAMVVAGDRRFRIGELDESRPYVRAKTTVVSEPGSGDLTADFVSTVRERFVDYCAGLGAPSAAATLPDDPTALSYLIAATVMLPLGDRQALLESPDATHRLQTELMLLSRELALLRAGSIPAAQPRLPPNSQN